MAYTAYVRITDILRKEGSGKLIAVGQYTDTLAVSRLPITINQLVFMTSLRFAPNEYPRKATLKVELPGGEVLTSKPGIIGTIPEEARQRFNLPFFEARGDWPLKNIRLIEEGFMKISLIVDGEEVPAGFIPIHLKTPQGEKVPDELLLIKAWVDVGSDEALAAMNRLMSEMNNFIEGGAPTAEDQKHMMLTMKNGDEGYMICFVAHPVNDWQNTVQFDGLTQDARPTIEDHNAFYCRYRLPTSITPDMKLEARFSDSSGR